MNVKHVDNRLKAADPVKEVELTDRILESAVSKKTRRKLSPPQLKYSIIGAATATIFALAAPSFLSGNSNGYLISLGANQSTQTNERGGAGESAADSASPKIMTMLPWVQYEYVAGEKLKTESGTGTVYEIALNGDPESVLENVAKAFGLTGSAKQQEVEYGENTYVIGSQDGNAASVSMWWGGTGNWWYSNPAAWPTPKCLHYTDSSSVKGEDIGADSESGAETWCDQYEELPATPELIPSEGSLTAQAVKIFNATGLKVTADEVTVNRDDWGAWASASLKVAGQDTPIEWTINWGQNGKLGYASGQSISVIERGKFDTISEKDAVVRLADWRYSGAIASSLWQKYAPNNGPMLRGGGIAVDDAATSDGTISNDDLTEPSAPVEPSIDPIPSPSLISAVVNKVHSALVMIWDKNGAAWLVPGYVYLPDVEYSWPVSVFSLVDGLVELPERGDVGIAY
jgi:hypothetical protein